MGFLLPFKSCPLFTFSSNSSSVHMSGHSVRNNPFYPCSNRQSLCSVLNLVYSRWQKSRVLVKFLSCTKQRGQTIEGAILGPNHYLVWRSCCCGFVMLQANRCHCQYIHCYSSFTDGIISCSDNHFLHNEKQTSPLGKNKETD